ncbi:sigma-70 family RNA polymerase sigma factor [Pseudoflavonifractor capillosus]|jgi:RNA polymerase sigma factor, sigma-70 family|uniref:sigma-70 family RNA polymerase sigma factor n=1 Tax=Oscillospiraceae TaxID=216572 RepID=UPI000B3A151C|nr:MULTISPECIES: sigma-70 family RNA polymerase sigma factor [Oscillospiraceae]MBM6896162.1 sigma-70 family RNA polymerase sigma factor [Pseudoflavonifractor capillosus]OUN11870.1 hypothetical protein B5G40_06280 [Flavonifractor sp. An9]
MKFIDLRKEYPHLDSTYSEYPVSYKIDAVFEEYRLAEQALEKRRTRNGDVVSLDSDPGIEAHIADHQPGPEDETIKHIQNEALYKALRSIPRKQAERIYAYYFMDMTLDEIAEAEGVYKSAVRKSIMLGKQKLKEILLQD